jgi:hypothetical protein
LFNTGDVLTAAQVNTYLNEQTVMVFANAAARTSALTSVLAEGMMSYLQDTNSVEVYNGSSWVNVGNAGDITEVQAGVGISIASGTGPIPVITNSSTDLITTAGDLLYGTAADTVARLGIGTAGQVLKVNSGATAPEWGAAAASGFVGASIYNSASQSISNTTYTILTFDSEVFDTDSFHDTATNNSRITIPSGKGGKYLIVAKFHFAGNATGTNRLGGIVKNGTNVGLFRGINGNSSSVGWNASVILNLVATDYIELEVYQDSGGSLNAIGGSVPPEYNYLQVQYLGA